MNSKKKGGNYTYICVLSYIYMCVLSYIYMCVLSYIYMCVLGHIRVCSVTYVCVLSYIYTYVFSYIYMYVLSYIHVCSVIYMCVLLHTCACSVTCTCVCSVTCMCAQLHIHVCAQLHIHVCARVLSCVRLCNPMDCSPSGFSIHGIFQARILEQAAISSSRGSSRPRDQTCDTFISCIGKQILYHHATWEALHTYADALKTPRLLHK